ncbi:triosephosphate isomerase [Xylariales sp. PMI_506]|nr:triosephosphate isomerase [Xylariales sp. PMI_506]
MAPPAGRRRIVGVSTKMYFSAAKTKQYVKDVLTLLDGGSSELLQQVDVFVIPDHVTLAGVVTQLEGSNILVGAQDAYFEDKGAFTGEVSPAVLAEVGCQIVELGHAERRALFGETDEDTARKAAAAVRNGMTPLVCIGERVKTQQFAAAVDECSALVRAVMAAVPDDANIILAYEPVWAIGASEPAGPEHVVSVVGGIRALECVAARRGTTRILYGGSAGPGLFAKLTGGVDGLFLGRFAHDPAQFYKTIQEIASV